MYNDGKVFATAFSRRAIDPAAGSVLLASGGTDQLRVFAYDPGAGGGAEAEAVGILAEDGPGPGRRPPRTSAASRGARSAPSWRSTSRRPGNSTSSPRAA